MSGIIKTQDSRRIFIETLKELAVHDDKIIVIIPDVGFNYLSEPTLPFRVVNTGVTEMFSTIFAANLALAGWKPYIYSMINFVVFRPYEMVRNAICMHKANVKLIGVKGSTGYRFLGFSHNLLTPNEDFKVLEDLPIDLYQPRNNDEVKKAIYDSYQSNEPSYIRL